MPSSSSTTGPDQDKLVPMTPSEALETLSAASWDAIYAYAAKLDLTDPESHAKLTAYTEQLADWLEQAMRPIIEAATPPVLH